MNTENAILVTIKVSGWWGQKSSKDASNALTEAEGLSRDAIVVLKNLVTDDFRLDLHAADSEISKIKSTWLVPTGATSLYTLPIDAKPKFDAAILDAEIMRTDTVRTVLEANYQNQIDHAANRLGARFNANDYPSIEDIVARFRVKVTYMPMPAPENTGIDDDDLKAAVAEARREATDTAQRVAWDRLYSTCRDFVARLQNYHDKVKDGQKTRYHTTVVENLQGLVESLELMNIFDDDKLAHSLTVLKGMIAHVAPETLKADEVARLNAIAIAQSVIDGAMPAKAEPMPSPSGIDWQPVQEEENAVVTPEPVTVTTADSWDMDDLL